MPFTFCISSKKMSQWQERNDGTSELSLHLGGQNNHRKKNRLVAAKWGVSMVSIYSMHTLSLIYNYKLPCTIIMLLQKLHCIHSVFCNIIWSKMKVVQLRVSRQDNTKHNLALNWVKCHSLLKSCQGNRSGRKRPMYLKYQQHIGDYQILKSI